MTKRLSIIVPIYNVEAYLAECLDSLVLQNLDPASYEILCINDGSTDGSLTILKSYREKYPQIVIVDKPNGGVSAARNDGLRKAEGRYVWFIDSDDIVAHNSLARLLEIAEGENLECLVFGRHTFEDGATVDPTFHDSDRIDIVTDPREIHEATSQRNAQNSTVYFRKATWFMLYDRAFLLSHEMFYNEAMSHNEDEVYTYFCRKYLRRVGYFHALVYFHRSRLGSLAKSDDEPKRKKYFSSLAIKFGVYLKELNTLSEEDPPVYNYMKKQVCETAVVALYQLLLVNDRRFIKENLHYIRQMSDYLFDGRYVAMPASRKIAKVFKKILPMKLWFRLMWVMMTKKRHTYAYGKA